MYHRISQSKCFKNQIKKQTTFDSTPQHFLKKAKKNKYANPANRESVEQ